jgi:hypothetical protein
MYVFERRGAIVWSLLTAGANELDLEPGESIWAACIIGMSA